MQECLGDMNKRICLIYIDDLISVSRSYEEHLQRLDQVFTKLKVCNLKLAPEKCYFLRSMVSFLGHVVSGDWG